MLTPVHCLSNLCINGAHFLNCSLFFQVLVSCSYFWSDLHEFMHHSMVCMCIFFTLLFQGLAILWYISFFNLAFELLETSCPKLIFSLSNYTTRKVVVCLVYFYTCMHFESCCVLEHQLLEFYMLKFIDLQKAFSCVLSARLLLTLVCP